MELKENINDVEVVLVSDNINSIYTDTLTVAKVFEKEHKTILRLVRNLDDYDERIGLNKIVPSSYVNEQNKNQPMFKLDKETFTIVALSLTGKKAYKFKVAYVRAFERMTQQYFLLLEQEKEKLELKLKYSQKIVAVNTSTINRKKRSEELEQLKLKGYIDWETTLVEHKKFYVTELGATLGFYIDNNIVKWKGENNGFD